MAARLSTWIVSAATIGALALATAGCGTPAVAGSAAGAGSASTGSDTAPAAPSQATAPSAGTTARQVLQFPDKDLTVQLNGYDDTTKMVDFTLVTFVSGGPDDGHYAPDAKDTAAHRLPLAATAAITALSPLCTGAAPDGGDPNTAGSACTPAQFIAALHAGPAQVAKLHVDATDHIATLQEIFHP